MNELFGSLRSEFLRPLATLVFPGAIASIPYVLLIHFWFPGFDKFVGENLALMVAVAFLASMFVGLLLEDAGSDIESQWDRAKGKAFDDVWHRYLRLAFETEPVGQKYIRSVLLRLKFELGTIVGLVVASVGVVLCFFFHEGTLSFRPGVWVITSYATILVINGVLVGLLWKWAKEGHDILHKVREDLLRGVVLKEAAKDHESQKA